MHYWGLLLFLSVNLLVIRTVIDMAVVRFKARLMTTLLRYRIAKTTVLIVSPGQLGVHSCDVTRLASLDSSVSSVDSFDVQAQNELCICTGRLFF
jgi:hypothetical protein